MQLDHLQKKVSTFDLIQGLERVKGQTICLHGKCSKISNSFSLSILNEILIIRAGSHKMLARIANRGDPDQTASDLGLPCLSRPFL